MSDIVKRLRLLVQSDSSGAAIEAAYEIVCLRDKNDALAKSCAAATENNERLRAEVEKLEKALKLFACDCTESSLCKFPHGCPNYIARAALGDTHE